MFKKVMLSVMLVMMGLLGVVACAGPDEESNRVVIYSSAEEYRNEHFINRLREQFPNYEIVLEYMPTGNHAAKLLAEGTETECDITVDMEYGYLGKMTDILADLSEYDSSVFVDDTVALDNRYLPIYRNGGCVVINLDVLAAKGLDKPTCYEDLIKPEYKGLVSMPNPKSSGTGYMFLKCLVNAWGEDEAFAYFDELALNILQFTSSGSGPVNALVQGEAAIGLGMTGQAVTAINGGTNLEILFFEEGSPYSIYGYGIIAGKQDRECVQEVFNFFYTTLVDEDKALFFPEQIYKDKVFEVDNYPKNIPYSDMSNNSPDEKERLLAKWVY